jgi:two-component system, NarL family, nitrate/nitrite response regulator NarL
LTEARPEHIVQPETAPRLARTRAASGITVVAAFLTSRDPINQMTRMTQDPDRRLEAVSKPSDRAAIVELVLAETYPILLEGMEHVFKSEPGFRVLASCTNGDETLRAVRRHHPDVLVLDLEIPGDAMTILRELAADKGTTRVVLLAARLDEHEMLEATRLGVKGILLKSMARHLMIHCVRKVHRGATWLEKAAMARAVEQLLRHEEGYRDVVARLSPRELEIVRMGASGRSNKEIAEQLSIAEGTVKMHFHHIYEKLGFKSRLELTLYARDKGLFSPVFRERPPRPPK